MTSNKIGKYLESYLQKYNQDHYKVEINFSIKKIKSWKLLPKNRIYRDFEELKKVLKDLKALKIRLK